MTPLSIVGIGGWVLYGIGLIVVSGVSRKGWGESGHIAAEGLLTMCLQGSSSTGALGLGSVCFDLS